LREIGDIGGVQKPRILRRLRVKRSHPPRGARRRPDYPRSASTNRQPKADDVWRLSARAHRTHAL